MVLLWLLASLISIPETIDVEGYYYAENQTFLYGAYDSDAYMLCYDSSNQEVLFEILYPYDTNTKMIYVAEVNNGYILVIRAETIDILVTIDLEGTIISEKVFNEHKDAYHNHHQ